MGIWPSVTGGGLQIHKRELDSLYALQEMTNTNVGVFMWIKIKLDDCPGNRNMQMWVSEDGKYFKKGYCHDGKWTEVIYGSLVQR